MSPEYYQHRKNVEAEIMVGQSQTNMISKRMPDSFVGLHLWLLWATVKATKQVSAKY